MRVLFSSVCLVLGDKNSVMQKKRLSARFGKGSGVGVSGRVHCTKGHVKEDHFTRPRVDAFN